MSPTERATLELLPDVVVSGGRATLREAADPLAEHSFVAAVRASPFAPPDPTDVARDELRELVRRGDVVVEDGVYFAPEAITQAASLVAEMLAEKPEGVTVSEIRQRMGNTRKHAMPILARLDGTGVTRRRGNLRIAGPRLPSV